MTRFKNRCKLKTLKNRRCKLPKSKGCSMCWNHLHSSKIQQKYGEVGIGMNFYFLTPKTCICGL